MNELALHLLLIFIGFCLFVYLMGVFMCYMSGDEEIAWTWPYSLYKGDYIPAKDL